MSAEEDIVEYILKLIRAAVPEFTELLEEKIERKVRREWGGEKIIYIAKRGRREKAKVRAQIGIKTTQELIDEHGISRATLYRYIGEKKGSADE